MAIEWIDGLYVNGYIPAMQTSSGRVYSLRQKGVEMPSSALLGDLRRRYREQGKALAQAHGIPLLQVQ